MGVMEAMRRALASISAYDRNFGPLRDDERDFTLLFEHTILTMIPTIFMIIAAPFYVRYYSRRPVLVERGILYWLKTATSITYIAIEVANVALWSLSQYRAAFSISAAVLSLVSALAIATMLSAEHRHALRPSVFINLYLAIAIMLDVVKTRSYFLRHGLQVIGAVSCASAAVKLVLLALGEKSKRSQVSDPKLKKTLGKEAFSGFLNRSFFIWLNTTLFVGFRTFITVDDLDALGPEFSSKALSAKFKSRWAKADQAHRYCLLNASILSLSSSFIIIWLPRLCFTVFYFAQPFLLRDVVSYFSRHDRLTDERDGLIAATIVIYTGLAVSRAWYEHATYRASIFLRGMLIPEVFQKTLVLDHAKASDYSAMTLMSTDIDGIVEGARMFVEITASFIETAVGIGLLTTVTGAASFLVIIPSIITWLFAYRYAKRIPSARVAWNEGIQARVSATSQVFAQIKSIKMVGQVPQMVEYLQREREKEMELSRKYRTFSAVLTSTGLVSYCLTPIAVMAGALFWTTFKDGDSFNPVNAFTTLAIVGLIGLPLGHIMAGFPRLAGTVACFQRVQSYLRLQEKQEKRKILRDSPSKGLAPLALTEKDGDVLMPTETSKSVHSQEDVCPIEFVEASIGPSPDKVSVIHDASFRIARSKLTVVVGPTASGKSTLLKAMIGEAHIARGTVQLEHDYIAYCGQNAWLMNKSVRENILGNSELDGEWYKTVLHVCCLQEDIQRLSKGDETLAGSGGLQLSGGQRQRIALARAIYSRAPVLLLDDVLSALDHTTAMSIVDRLFGTMGLLRRMNHTVIVTTHSETLARVADQILILDNNGSVKSAGTPEEAGLGSSLTVEALRDLPFITHSEESETAPDETRLVEKEAKTELDFRNRKMGDTSLYVMYFKPVMKRVIVVWLLASIMYSVFERAPEIYMRVWLEVDPSNKLYFIGYGMLGTISGLFPMIMLSVFWNYLVPQTSKGLHKMLVNTAMSATLPFLTSTDFGYLINRFSQDMTLISQTLSEELWIVVYDTLISVMDIGIIAAGSKYLAIAVPLILATVYYIQLFYLRTSRQIRHLDLEKKTPLYTQFAEIATGIEHIRCFGWQKTSLAKCHELLDESQRPAYAMFCVQRWLTLAMDMLTLALATVLVVLAFHFNGVSQSGLGLALLNVTSFGKQLTGTVKEWTGLETALGALSRLQDFVKFTPVEKDKDNIPPRLSESWPERGEVEFRNLSVGYSDNTPKVIRNLSLKIKSGQKVGIVGRTGSGKTTIFLTLLKFLNYNGSVSIDGYEVSDVPLAVLRRRITTIPQDFIKYPGSIRDNLVPQDIMKEGGPSVQDSVLDEILGKVGAGVREEINLRGLDAPMESLGLSEGQKQLLTVARAIIHKRMSGTKIVLIDEGTSSVDLETDDNIQALMNEYFHDSTVISISHRQETMQNADLVYSLDNVVSQ